MKPRTNRLLTGLGVGLIFLFGITGCNQKPDQDQQQAANAAGTPEFKGKIELDVRNSVADWAPFVPKKAPEGSPNILLILYDDTGLGAWSPYGGRISMPTLDKLAATGLTYTQWHTCALCSPTRSTLLTGRNHTLNGMAAITEASNGFPGASGRVPEQCATMADILRDN
ncbi:MAG TPA: sulfatase-like hydrolase/transferase, partial [Puia sp.]|nr:sulfatase-like hydrolase/transferase [Puia sp.]